MNNEVKDRILEIFNNNQKIKDNPTCYIYNLKQISDQINEVQKYACKNVSLYYAMKANPNKEVISHILKHPFVKGIEIASTGELDIANESGLDTPQKVLFTGPGKTIQELERVVKKGGKIIIPTYINKENKSSLIAAKIFELVGADFKRQFDLRSYQEFFVKKWIL